MAVAKVKLMRLSRVKPQVEMDSVERTKMYGNRRAFDVLFEAQQYWDNMDRFRKDRWRNKRYTYGDQWKDVIEVDGESMTEEQYIMSQGNVPLKNNLIRRLVKNVLGVYRGQASEPVCTARDRDEQQIGETMSTVLQYNMQLNHMSEMNARTMEEFLISGFIVHKKFYGWRNNRLDCWTNYIQPNNFFIDSNMRDFRGWDVSCLGEVHDVDFNTVCQMFAKSPADYQRLSDIYACARNRNSFNAAWENFGYARLQNYDFLLVSDPTRCRVIEVWRKESKPRYRCHDYNSGEVYKIEVQDYADMVEAVNADRIQMGLEAGMEREDIPLIKAEWFMDDYWYYYYLTPFGDILDEGETPYAHKSHPYVFKAYPFIDGEIHSFVADVIDQQRYTNRLITLYDWIMRASAKGVLLIPEDCLKGYDINEIADEWSRFNGVIAYHAKPGAPMPQQVSANSTNIGISELLNLQLKFFEDISGVNGALQGKPGYAGESGSHAQLMAQNAATSLVDLLESFSDFVIDGAYKDVKNIQQYYDEKMVKNIAGRKANLRNVDAKQVLDADYDLSITENMATPAYRHWANDLLMELWRAQAINTEQLLEHGTFPFADELLQSLKSQQESMAQGQPAQGISPELMQQAQQGADMNAVNKAYNMLRGAA